MPANILATLISCPDAAAFAARLPHQLDYGKAGSNSCRNCPNCIPTEPPSISNMNNRIYPRNMTFLFEIADVIELSGRGCFILSEISPAGTVGWLVKVGDRILVRKRDGSDICTKICSIEFVDNLPQKKSWLALGVSQDVYRSDFEVGSPVWLIENSERRMR